MDNGFNIEHSLLNESLLEKLPEWWKNINKEDYYLVAEYLKRDHYIHSCNCNLGSYIIYYILILLSLN